MKSNFSFLESMFPVLEKHGTLAENYLYSDPNACLYKLGIFAETVVNYIFNLDNLQEPQTDNSLLAKIKILKDNGLLPNEIDDILFQLRIKRNKAVHEGHESLDDCKILLKMAYHLGSWFMETYGEWDYKETPFVMPVQGAQDEEKRSLITQNEALLKKLQSMETSEQTSKASSNKISMEERRKKSNTAADNMRLSESETRRIIDEQLRKVGWEVDSIKLKYSEGTRPKQGKNLAIAEWQTDSKIANYGKVDYALFVGLRLVGIIEAKRSYKDVSSVIDYQCKDYATTIKAEHAQYVIDDWNGYKVPFLFATNGRPYIKKYELKSGIWFRDARDISNTAKAQRGWMSPEGMLELLEKDIENANKKLMETPYNLLIDKDGLNLRKYQIKAIEAAEKAVIDGQQSILLSMATGTGKTRTILGMIYRFLKTERFKRILFLVDRTALGEQAQDVFKEVKLEDLMTLDKIYNIKTLEEKEIEKETKIHVATVQSLVKRILYNESDTIPSVTDYDLIVIDEAHRGYILDKEMSENEVLYRNQVDYMSKYRAVIEYFDAVKIALTATPALHTTEIFGKPVFNYSYREAVIEGYLVDHDAPHNLVTKLSEKGIVFEKGEILNIYYHDTGEVLPSDELEDELVFDVDDFNRKVVTPNFNRVVLEEIVQDINPEGDGKTLIFAVDDDHADLIVNILKELYKEMGIPNDAVMKITGSVGGGNKKKVSEAIKLFKNERYPNIAVTVDLLTTGVDVPKITTLVFMRRVKSRILFEQMLGRATRLCPDIGKTHFEIYDPVRVYESLEPVNTMKPVAQTESASFEDLLNGLNHFESSEQLKNHVDLIVGKIERKKSRMSQSAEESFKAQSGGLGVEQFVERIKKMTPEQAKDYFIENQDLFELLSESNGRRGRAVVISDKEDELISHTRGYGNTEKPEDYLDEFNNFINTNINNIMALNIVCTKPKELTREALKTLKLELDKNGFTEKMLNTAWREMKNEEVVADIISFIRRYALGIDLLSHEHRISRAIKKLKENHNFNKTELDWLGRIEKALMAETILNEETFETGAFKANGGFNEINKRFKGKLNDIIQELNDYLYEDGGQTA